jgi:hypothetical protein
MDILKKSLSLGEILTERPNNISYEQYKEIRKRQNERIKWYKSSKIRATDRAKIINH